MIHSISSNIDTFKTFQFLSGFNIIVSDKSSNSSDLQTRNGSGKTSLIELIHFMLGADVNKEGIFKSESLKKTSFTMSLNINNTLLEVRREVSSPNYIFYNEEVPEGHTKSKFGKVDGLMGVKNSEWKEILGDHWFHLKKLTDNEEERKFQPTFRSLISYFIRRQSAKGFSIHNRYSEKQQTWNEQVSLSYLIGLDWQIPQKFELLSKKMKTLKDLNSQSLKNELGKYFSGSASDLRTQLTVAKSKLSKLNKSIEEFKVVPEYEKFEQEASHITLKINELNNKTVIDHELLLDLRNAIEDEAIPDTQNLVGIYQEAKINFPELVLKRFDEVERFNLSIINNRRFHLQSEIDSAEKRIKEKEIEKLKSEQRRSQLMGILQSGGALQHYSNLREEAARMESNVLYLEKNLEIISRLETVKAELKIGKASLFQLLMNDLHERKEIIDEAILTFEAISEALYLPKHAGSLTISATDKGPDFEIKIDGKRSTGINNMQIFCFDLMLMELCLKRNLGPKFLIHDGHIFDGVDERQIAKALQIGAEKSEKLGFQYIITMNSDIIPWNSFSKNFNINKYILPTRLTDDEQDGGLFGFRFN